MKRIFLNSGDSGSSYYSKCCAAVLSLVDTPTCQKLAWYSLQQTKLSRYGTLKTHMIDVGSADMTWRRSECLEACADENIPFRNFHAVLLCQWAIMCLAYKILQHAVKCLKIGKINKSLLL